MTPSDLLSSLRPLLAAEAAAEAYGTGIEPADLEQGVWLRFLERGREPGPPSASPAVAAWLRAAVRTEGRDARLRAGREVPYGAVPGGPAAPPGATVEERALAAEDGRVLRTAVERLPERCRRLLGAILSSADLTYREIAGELGISQGSLGPIRSRCLGCLRRMLTAEVGAPELRGKER